MGGVAAHPSAGSRSNTRSNSTAREKWAVCVRARAKRIAKEPRDQISERTFAAHPAPGSIIVPAHAGFDVHGIIDVERGLARGGSDTSARRGDTGRTRDAAQAHGRENNLTHARRLLLLLLLRRVIGNGEVSVGAHDGHKPAGWLVSDGDWV